MAAKKTMTLNLTEQEMSALEELAGKKDMSKTAVIRQALKLYHLVDYRAEQGARMYFENIDRKEKSELSVL